MWYDDVLKFDYSRFSSFLLMYPGENKYGVSIFAHFQCSSEECVDHESAIL